MRAMAASAPSLSISQIAPASAQEWDAIYRDCAYATYFHSRDWVELWRALAPEALVALPELVRFSDGREALLPLPRKARTRSAGPLLPSGLNHTLTSSIDSTFGGWISRDELKPEHAKLLTDHMLSGLKSCLVWRLNPYDPHATLVMERVRAHAAQHAASDSKAAKLACCILNWRKPLMLEDHTHAIDLSPGIKALFPSQSAIARKARKASKLGVSIRIADRLEDWQEYYRVYQKSLVRWGRHPTTAYPWELFQAMFQLGSENVKLWTAIYDGVIVCGAVCLYAKNHVAYWQGGALEAYFELRPVNLLMLEIMRHASAQGYTWYDFNPSGFVAGVVAFKESFGARRIPSPMVYVDRGMKRAARAVMLGLRGY